MRPHADVMILGLGAMGSAAAVAAARRGARVVGFEQFSIAHDLGSSHGRTRIIRMAYYEHPDYVPLLRSAYAGWERLADETGAVLYHPCGVLNMGTADSAVIRGVTEAAAQHRLPIERLDAEAIAERFPPFCLPEGVVGIFERNAGLLRVEACVAAQWESARRAGAELHPRTTVHSWHTDGAEVVVETSLGPCRAARLIVTAGAWSSRFLKNLVPLTVMRQVQFWFAPPMGLMAARHFPGWILDDPSGAFYGLPALDEHGVKIARHYGAPELDRPESVERSVGGADLEPIADFMRRVLPTVAPTPIASSVCMYTLTPDRHFCIDRHPELPQVVFAAGFSGHGFKFAPIVGEILTDLALNGSTVHPIALFRSDRFTSPRPW